MFRYLKNRLNYCLLFTGDVCITPHFRPCISPPLLTSVRVYHHRPSLLSVSFLAASEDNGSDSDLSSCEDELEEFVVSEDDDDDDDDDDDKVVSSKKKKKQGRVEKGRKKLRKA